jgi:hypothetical protein
VESLVTPDSVKRLHPPTFIQENKMSLFGKKISIDKEKYAALVEAYREKQAIDNELDQTAWVLGDLILAHIGPPSAKSRSLLKALFEKLEAEKVLDVKLDLPVEANVEYLPKNYDDCSPEIAAYFRETEARREQRFINRIEAAKRPLSIKRLRQLYKVAAAYPPDRRYSDYSIDVHIEAGSPDELDKILEIAEEVVKSQQKGKYQQGLPRR